MYPLAMWAFLKNGDTATRSSHDLDKIKSDILLKGIKSTTLL
ncbi:hypothetical protein BVRB_3g051280 [Beta vulgaris subsp. vulgaris]|nr:hypothetical protein BVRB_3g051280 [Beta vulgaris subsp. vulgaris]